MFSNYLKVAIRNILRHKGYTFIKVISLAMGLACCILILLFIRFEYNYDGFHENADRIYRVIVDIKTGDNLAQWAATPEPLGPTLRSNFAGIESVARIQEFDRSLIKVNETSFYENRLLVADPELVDVLTIPFISGDPQTALKRPGSLVITKSLAEKYFAENDPLGESVQIQDHSYEVTGVVADPPGNTHLKYTSFISFESIIPHDNMQNWGRMSSWTYVKLKPSADVGMLEENINRVLSVQLKQIPQVSHREFSFRLQPLTSIHLHSRRWSEIDAPGNPTTLFILGGIALLILGVAVTNFINLSTARLAARGREAGMRRIIGACRHQLIFQFTGEAVILTFAAFILGCILAELFLPLMKDLTRAPLTLIVLFEPVTLLGIIGAILLLGVSAGGYPAMVFASFKPATAMKVSKTTTSRGVNPRRILVIGQFAVSILLIVALVTVYQQREYMLEQSLGFEKEQKLILSIPEHISVTNSYEAVSNSFIANPGVQGVAFSSGVPGRIYKMHIFKASGSSSEDEQRLFHLHVDESFISEYGINMVAGRAFSTNFVSDRYNTAIINEEAVRVFGWKTPQEAVGKTVLFGDKPYDVIGVVEDFHYDGLQYNINPLFIDFDPSRFRCLTLTVRSNDIQGILTSTEQVWKGLFPECPLEYFFLDTDFDSLYNREMRTGKMVGGLTLLAIIISSLGLFGLAAFSAERRTKEIGIRKVLGATVTGIVKLLTREFILLVVVANIIAWPIAYYAMNRWLENFAYRIELEPLVFIISGLAALLIAVLTVSFQAIRAATANPVKALRYE